MNAIAIKPRKVKEPSIQSLARQKARGNGHAKVDVGRLSPTLSEELARQMRQRALKLADEAVDQGLPEEDREFLYAISRGQQVSPADVARFAMLSDRVAARGNGNGKSHAEAPRRNAARPANSPASPAPLREKSTAELGPVITLELSQLVRHPDNRHPTQEDVKARAASIEEKGQLEPIIVRKLDTNKYEVLSGETRWLAVKANGGKSIEARVRQCSDAEALELVAEANAQRKDLNPIERAKLIERLCQPVTAGGSGLTRDAAAVRVGLKDGSSASNLVRLLKLPKVWQQRVAGGELPESFARLMVPYAHAPKLMEELDKKWIEEHGPKSNEGDREDWETRAELERELHWQFEKHTRPVDAKDTFAYDFHFRKRWGKVDHTYEYEREYQRLFELTPELEQQLEIHEFDPSCLWERERKKGGKDTPLRRATNCELWDKHQIPAVKEHVAKSKKGKAEKAGRDAPAPKRELSPAELKQRRRQMTDALNGRRDAWRDKLLRRACVEALEAGLDSGLRILLAAAADDRAPYGAIKFHEALEHVRGVKPRSNDWRAEYWPCVAEISERSIGEGRDFEQTVISDLAKTFLAHEPKDWRRPTLPHTLVESYAQAIGININQAWSNLQGSEPGRELLEEFFLIHQTEPLRELAKELGVHTGALATRGGIVKLLMGTISGHTTRRLPLPKCIKPLGGVPGKRKAGKGK